MRYAALVLLVAAGSARAGAGTYSIDDLAALDKLGAWVELEAHLLDIAPTARDPRWQTFVEHAAMGLVASHDGHPDDAARVAAELTKRYPSLAKAPAFMKKRADVGLAALADCATSEHGVGMPVCAMFFLDYVDDDPGNRQLALGGARLIATVLPARATPFFRRAFAGQTAPKECAEPAVGASVVAALALDPPDNDLAAAIEIADKLCWDATKDAVVDGFVTGGSRYKQNSCDFLAAHHALSPLSAKQCQSTHKGTHP